MLSTMTYVPPGGGTSHRMIDGDHVAKATVVDRLASFEVFEVIAQAGPPAPPHVSPWTGVLYLLEGGVTAQLEGQTVEVEPGGLVVFPAGAACTFTVTAEPARFLAITTGDQAGRFFADFAASVSPDAPLESVLPDIMAVTDRHGVRVAPPAAG
jgi:quercetin dioxygenase-like cupin family protein